MFRSSLPVTKCIQPVVHITDYSVHKLIKPTSELLSFNKISSPDIKKNFYLHLSKDLRKPVGSGNNEQSSILQKIQPKAVLLQKIGDTTKETPLEIIYDDNQTPFIKWSKNAPKLYASDFGKVATERSGVTNLKDGKIDFLGYSLEECLQRNYAEIISLFLSGHLPENKAEYLEYQKKITQHCEVSLETKEKLKELIKLSEGQSSINKFLFLLQHYTNYFETTYPMYLVKTNLEARIQFCQEVLGWIMTITNFIVQDALGYDFLQMPDDPKSMSILEILLTSIYGKKILNEFSELEQLWGMAFLLLADHGLSISTSTFRICLSAGNHPLHGMISAFHAMLGDKHAGTLLKVGEMLHKLRIHGIEGYLDLVYSGKEKIAGIGHYEDKNIDQRTETLFRICEKHWRIIGIDEQDLNLVLDFYQATKKSEYLLKRKLFLNVQVPFYLFLTGKLTDDLCVVMFAQARILGLSAHMHEIYTADAKPKRNIQVYKNPLAE